MIMKKPLTIVALALVVLLLIVTAFYFAFTDPPQNETENTMVNGNQEQEQQLDEVEPVWIAVKDRGQDSEVYQDFETNLLNLFFDYRDAMLLTQASLHVKHEQISLDEFTALNNQALAKWDEVESDVDSIVAYGSSEPTSWVWDIFKTKYSNISPLIPAAQAFGDEGTTEVGLKFSGFDQVDYLKSAVPSIDEELVIKSEFGGTAKEVKQKLIEYHSYTAENWNDWVKIHDYSSKTFKAIELSSKVGLFIGGAVISGGGTLAAGVGAIDGTLMTISGADLICDLGQGATALGFADKSTGETFAYIQQKGAPITFIANVADVSNYAENAGGAINAAYGLANVTADALDIKIENGGMYIKPNIREDIRIPQTTADGIVENYFPQEYVYDTDITPTAMKDEENRLLNEQKEAQEQADSVADQAMAYVGPYQGNIDAQIPGLGNVSIPIELLVGHEQVKMTFSNTQSLPYKITGSPYAISIDYSYRGELNGDVNKNKTGFNLSGNFASEGKTNIPADISKYMTPEAMGGLNTVNNGSATAQGLFTSDGSKVSGNIKFSGSQMTVDATFTATHRVEYSDGNY